MPKENELTHEVLARGICCRGGFVLLCRHKGMRRSFLPGGHIDPLESGADALVREISEELGVRASAVEFLGASEHFFEAGGGTTCEISLCYTMELSEIKTGVNPVAREGWLEFFWQPVDSLGEAGLEPFPLAEALPEWLKNHARQNFASTYTYADTDKRRCI